MFQSRILTHVIDRGQEANMRRLEGVSRHDDQDQDTDQGKTRPSHVTMTSLIQHITDPDEGQELSTLNRIGLPSSCNTDMYFPNNSHTPKQSI